MEGKIAILGESDFVSAFSALGTDTFTAENSEQALDNAKKILENKYALIVVCESTMPLVEEIFAARQNAPLPCILVVPFTGETKGTAAKALGKVLKMATGIDNE
ncbi:MAG: hypothetical protein JXB29_05910 [Sedimentisphaerales bacterium]|nr:hypothetical protein [Sedimentisphaerales bacterium]